MGLEIHMCVYIYIYKILIVIFFIIFSVHGNIISVSMAGLTYR